MKNPFRFLFLVDEDSLQDIDEIMEYFEIKLYSLPKNRINSIIKARKQIQKYLNMPRYQQILQKSKMRKIFVVLRKLDEVTEEEFWDFLAKKGSAII